jgi:hypothetical protein
MLPSPPACTAKSEKSRQNSTGKMKGMHFFFGKLSNFRFAQRILGLKKMQHEKNPLYKV